jgi:glycosyltransferase involved in cell wall biosynthesis
VKIAIVAPSSVPYVVGGSERAALGLLEAINEGTPHDADLIKLPSHEHSFDGLVDSYHAFAELDLTHFDAVISTKYPSWMVRHPRHVVYLHHTLRGLYDTYHTMGLPFEPDLSDGSVRDLIGLLDQMPPGSDDGWRVVLDRARVVADKLGRGHPALAFPGPVVRRLIRWLDRDALDSRNITAHLAISKTVAARPDYFPPGVVARGLPLPSSLKGVHRGPFLNLFTASRLDGAKRVDLLIRSMQYVSADISLRIAGGGPIEESLRELAADDRRIEFLGRISDEELVDEYAQAFAVPFVPLDEDLGLVTIEAHMSGKPVITCTDSGGVAELVEHGVTGLVVAPEPRALARAIDALAIDRALAERMGEAGAQSSGGFTWPRVANALLGAIGGPRRTRAPAVRQTAGRIVVLSTYGVSPARGGGQIRVGRLLHGLAKRYEVDLIALDDGASAIGATELAPGLRQVVFERSELHRQHEGKIGSLASIPIGDIAASMFVQETTSYVNAFRAASRRADLAILAQPYMAPLLSTIAPDMRFIYDSQNGEYAMKRAMLGTSGIGAELAEAVRLVEISAVRRAEMVTVCSSDDQQTLQTLTPTMAEFRLIPNGADVEGIRFVSGPERTANRDRWLDGFAASSTRARPTKLALFVASYHPPNLQAAEFILKMAPLLPDVAFVLAGTHCLAFENWRLPDNVVLRGQVPDGELRYLLAAADVGINPMSSGAGTNLKIIEYLAAGVPSVSTPTGVRGLAVSADELLIVGLSEFAESVAAVLSTPTESAERARLGRAFVERAYDWNTIAGDFVSAVDHVISTCTGRTPDLKRPLGR